MSNKLRQLSNKLRQYKQYPLVVRPNQSEVVVDVIAPPFDLEDVEDANPPTVASFTDQKQHIALHIAQFWVDEHTYMYKNYGIMTWPEKSHWAAVVNDPDGERLHNMCDSDDENTVVELAKNLIDNHHRKNRKGNTQHTDSLFDEDKIDEALETLIHVANAANNSMKNGEGSIDSEITLRHVEDARSLINEARKAEEDATSEFRVAVEQYERNPPTSCESKSRVVVVELPKGIQDWYYIDKRKKIKQVVTQETDFDYVDEAIIIHETS